MSRFFVNIDGREIGTDIHITGGDVNHIRNVLRLAAGDEIDVCDGRGRDYHCIISFIGRDEVVCRVCDVSDSFAELPVEVTLFQGYPKSDKLELIVQKMVELGVHRIVPVVTARSVARPDPAKTAKKTARYNAISASAAEQSGRGIIPEVTEPVSWKQAISMAEQLDMNIIPYEEAEGLDRSRKIVSNIQELSKRQVIPEISAKTDPMPEEKKRLGVAEGSAHCKLKSGGRPSLGIFIGPEGGFTADEVKQAQELSAECITLGHRILRTETAGLAVMSIIMFAVDRD